MIRSSALLTAVAMAMLVAGVVAASLSLIYLSVAVSILAAVTLAAGVLLRRRELFGEAGAAPLGAQPDWAAGQTARATPVPARSAMDDRVTADRDGRRADDRRDGEQQRGPGARRKAVPGAAAGTGPARWPASIAAKGAPATARPDDGRPARPDRAGRPASGREPAARAPGPREPARGDRAAREPADREPARQEPAAREGPGREPVPTGSTERGPGWSPPSGRARTASGEDRSQAAPVRSQAAPPRSDREQAGRERDEAATGQHAEAFRLPPPSEQTRARAEELGRATSGGRAGDDFWDRVSEELADGGSQDPIRPAWPASAGPRAMGTGSAARRAPGETADEREEARPAGSRRRERAPGDRDRVVPPYVDDLSRRGRQRREPEREPAGADEPGDAARAGATAGPAASSGWSAWSAARAGDRDTADAGRAGETAAEETGRDGTPADVSARPGAGRGAADAGQAGRDSMDRGPAPAKRASRPATAGAAAGTETGVAGETGDHEAEAGVQGAGATGAHVAGDTAAGQPAEVGGGDEQREASADEPADRAEQGRAAAPRPGDGAPSGADRSDDADDLGQSDGAAGAGAAGSAPLDGEVTVVPGVPRYHRRGCILIRFLSDGDLETTTRPEAESAGLVPCKACQPDKSASAG